MRKTTVMLDEELLKEASEILGTKGVKQTVERSLQEVVTLRARLRFLDQLSRMDGLDLDKPEIMRRAWVGDE